MCTVHCNEGYDMAFRPRPWYYCESDGNWRKGNTKWSKKPTVPECSGTKIAQATASPGGGTWVFFGWVCAARGSKLAPRSKKNFS